MITLNIPRDEAHAFAEFLKRMGYEDCAQRSNRRFKYTDGRDQADVMWASVCIVQDQLRDAGIAPR